MENGAEECSFDWGNVRKCISSTRKTMRDYSDRIDDGRIRGKDVGPCQTCKNGLVKECKGLEEEIETMREHLMRVDVDVDKEICSCMCMLLIGTQSNKKYCFISNGIKSNVYCIYLYLFTADVYCIYLYIFTADGTDGCSVNLRPQKQKGSKHCVHNYVKNKI